MQTMAGWSQQKSNLNDPVCFVFSSGAFNAFLCGKEIKNRNCPTVARGAQRASARTTSNKYTSIIIILFFHLSSNGQRGEWQLGVGVSLLLKVEYMYLLRRSVALLLR